MGDEQKEKEMNDIQIMQQNEEERKVKKKRNRRNKRKRSRRYNVDKKKEDDLFTQPLTKKIKINHLKSVQSAFQTKLDLIQENFDSFGHSLSLQVTPKKMRKDSSLNNLPKNDDNKENMKQAVYDNPS